MAGTYMPVVLLCTFMMSCGSSQIKFVSLKNA
jgi:hypothetical protein